MEVESWVQVNLMLLAEPGSLQPVSNISDVENEKMTVEQTNAVDIIGTNPKTNQVILAISDHLEWTGDDQADKFHMYLLQQKFNSYLEFLESGEIYRKYPDAVGKEVVIKIMSKFPMNDEAKAFLEKAGAIVMRYGYKVEFHNS
jgi:hypothetical protein